MAAGLVEKVEPEPRPCTIDPELDPAVPADHKDMGLPCDLSKADLDAETLKAVVKQRKDMRARAWAFTLNNYTPVDIQRVLDTCRSAVYGIAGFEVGKKEGTPHLQGYLYFREAKTWSVLMKFAHFSYLKPAYASAERNRAYCRKDCKLLCEFGICPKPGCRTDIERTYMMLRSGCSFEDLVHAGVGTQCFKIAEYWYKYAEPKRDFRPKIWWLVGPTGCGKTTYVHKVAGPRLYTAPRKLEEFWEGYDGHTSILIDDMRVDRASYGYMLNLLDQFELRVPVKGSSRQFRAENIYITAPFPPEEMYAACGEDIRQLTTRLTKIITVPPGAVCYRPDPVRCSFDEHIAQEASAPIAEDASWCETRDQERFLQEETEDPDGEFKNFIHPDYLNLGVNSKCQDAEDPGQGKQELRPS